MLLQAIERHVRIEQRVRALNAFLHDLYHRQEIVRSGRLPARLLKNNVAFLPEMVGFTPPGGVYTHIVGIDLVRTGIGIAVRKGAPKPDVSTPEALKRAAQDLVNAKGPIIIADMVGRNPKAIPMLIELAELLAAPVVDRGARFNVADASASHSAHGSPLAPDKSRALTSP